MNDSTRDNCKSPQYVQKSQYSIRQPKKKLNCNHFLHIHIIAQKYFQS